MSSPEGPHALFGRCERYENSWIEPLDAATERLFTIAEAACKLDRTLLNIPSARNINADDGKGTRCKEGD
jgi:hypothetical protein